MAQGAYILADAEGGKPEVILIGTGSEVSLCVKAREKLKEYGVQARVVSMPSWELFEEQEAAIQDQVLPKAINKRVTIEAASDVRLGAMGGHGRDHHRDQSLRRVGTGRLGDEALRIHGGACHGCRVESDGAHPGSGEGVQPSRRDFSKADRRSRRPFLGVRHSYI